jgi:hypothetical protein
VKVGAFGEMRWDEFQSRRETYIGPCPGDVCPLLCPSGLGDCDAITSNGCETSLRTFTDCGACGAPCSQPNSTCGTGVCEACPAGAGECDGEPTTVCETPLDTTADCGACGVACGNEHGSTACAGGTCAPTCDPGWDSCDGDPANGCERSIRTLADCGACGELCSLPNGGETCEAGTCTLGSCDVGFGNCDSLASNGCEQPLNTLTHCSQCFQGCTLPNASETCGTGTCAIASCDTGFSNCDGSQATGCEVRHSGYSNTSPGENLGPFDADASSGFLCPGQGCDFLLARTGTRGRFFQITAREGSTCCAYVSLRFELVVPPGVDYDLYVTGAPLCDSVGCSSRGGTGADESLVVWSNDDCAAADDTFTAVVEVRYLSGASCAPWVLNVYRREC